MSIIHCLICFACKQEGFVSVNHRVTLSTFAWLFSRRLAFSRQANVTLILCWSFFIICLWHSETEKCNLTFSDLKDALIPADKSC